MKLTQKAQPKGFTLLEMVIVIGIIGVLAAGAITLMGNFGDTAKIQRAKTEVTNTLPTVLKSYEILANTYPSTQQGLQALVEKPTDAPVPKQWSKQLDRVPLDPWGNEYRYTNNNGKILITSDGPDKEAGTEDDISSDDK